MSILMHAWQSVVLLWIYPLHPVINSIDCTNLGELFSVQNNVLLF